MNLIFIVEGAKNMKGISPSFSGYNGAKSSSVGIVNSKNEINIKKEENYSIPIKGVPNSVTIIRKNGIVHQERYYDKDGNPHLDIDYSDHGNPKKHPVVPHEHKWTRLPNGKYKRGKWNEIK